MNFHVWCFSFSRGQWTTWWVWIIERIPCHTEWVTWEDLTGEICKAVVINWRHVGPIWPANGFQNKYQIIRFDKTKEWVSEKILVLRQTYLVTPGVKNVGRLNLFYTEVTWCDPMIIFLPRPSAHFMCWVCTESLLPSTHRGSNRYSAARCHWKPLQFGSDFWPCFIFLKCCSRQVFLLDDIPSAADVPDTQISISPAQQDSFNHNPPVIKSRERETERRSDWAAQLHRCSEPRRTFRSCSPDRAVMGCDHTSITHSLEMGWGSRVICHF